MRTVISSLLALLLSGPSLIAARKALLIGNAQYENQDLLLESNAPVHDVEDLEKRLRTMEFSVVTLERNLGRDAFRNAITDFVTSLTRGDTALFYFAGHAIQLNGTNYLWPVDRGPVRQDDIEAEFVSIQSLYDGLRAAETAVNIVILDACRDNVFGPAMTTPYVPGLALPRAVPDSSFIAYSTQAGTIAIDLDVGSGDRKHSPYANALLSQIGRPGIPISDVFREVRNMVQSVTGFQVPAVENTLNEVFYFRPPLEIETRVSDVDDVATVTLNGVEQFSTLQKADGRLRLHGGENRVAILLFNQRSFTGGIEFLGGRKPEGWRYRAEFVRDGQPRPFVELQAGEDTPTKDGPRHGKLFTVARFTILVDNDTGEMTVQQLERDAWMRAGSSFDPAPAGLLTDDVRRSLLWALNNTGNVECPMDYLPYADCLIMGQRLCLMRRAASLARDGKAAEAFRLALVTQCHNQASQERCAAPALK